MVNETKGNSERKKEKEGKEMGTKKGKTTALLFFSNALIKFTLQKKTGKKERDNKTAINVSTNEKEIGASLRANLESIVGFN